MFAAAGVGWKWLVERGPRYPESGFGLEVEVVEGLRTVMRNWGRQSKCAYVGAGAKCPSYSCVNTRTQNCHGVRHAAAANGDEKLKSGSAGAPEERGRMWA